MHVLSQALGHDVWVTTGEESFHLLNIASTSKLLEE